MLADNIFIIRQCDRINCRATERTLGCNSGCGADGETRLMEEEKVIAPGLRRRRCFQRGALHPSVPVVYPQLASRLSIYICIAFLFVPRFFLFLISLADRGRELAPRGSFYSAVRITARQGSFFCGRLKTPTGERASRRQTKMTLPPRQAGTHFQRLEKGRTRNCDRRLSLPATSSEK